MTAVSQIIIPHLFIFSINIKFIYICSNMHRDKTDMPLLESCLSPTVPNSRKKLPLPQSHTTSSKKKTTLLSGSGKSILTQLMTMLDRETNFT